MTTAVYRPTPQRVAFHSPLLGSVRFPCQVMTGLDSRRGQFWCQLPWARWQFWCQRRGVLSPGRSQDAGLRTDRNRRQVLNRVRLVIQGHGLKKVSIETRIETTCQRRRNRMPVFSAVSRWFQSAFVTVDRREFLEMLYGGNSTAGSNPALSASKGRLGHLRNHRPYLPINSPWARMCPCMTRSSSALVVPGWRLGTLSSA